MKLWLIRHCEIAGQSGKIYGSTDVPLSEEGLAHAGRLGAVLKAYKFDNVYSSDMTRAKETVRAIVKGRGVDVSLKNELRELDFGRYEGGDIRIIRVIRSLYGDRADAGRSVPGMDDLDEFKARVAAAIEEIIENNSQGDNVLVVTHRIVIDTFLDTVSDGQDLCGKVSVKYGFAAIVECLDDHRNLLWIGPVENVGENVAPG
jgi:broad specificity phosphatase PhoE